MIIYRNGSYYQDFIRIPGLLFLSTDRVNVPNSTFILVTLVSRALPCKILIWERVEDLSRKVATLKVT